MQTNPKITTTAIWLPVIIEVLICVSLLGAMMPWTRVAFDLALAACALTSFGQAIRMEIAIRTGHAEDLPINHLSIFIGFLIGGMTLIYLVIALTDMH